MGGTLCCVTRKHDQIGEGKLKLPGVVINAYLRAIDETERLLGHPGTMADVCAVLYEQNSMFAIIKSGMPMHAIFSALLREDLIWVDKKHMAQWTTKPREGFHNFTEFWKMNNKGFKLSADQTCIPAEGTKTVNLKTLLTILKSKDASLMEENAWMFDGQIRLLDGEPIPTGQQVAFDTFPRTGNSFLRKFIEQISGVYTGANMPLHMTSMQHCQGMMGENIVDSRAWIIKSHHPLPIPDSKDVTSNKVICIVRNPLDAIYSRISLMNLASHSATLEFEVQNESPEWWDQYVQDDSHSHSNYYKYLMDDCVTQGKNPIYFLRFEDMIADKKSEVEKLFCFLLDLESLEGTNVQRQINKVMDEGQDQGKSYTLKKTTGVKNAHLHRYTPEQLKMIKEENIDNLFFFGYATYDEIKTENPTGFFHYDDPSDDMKSTSYGFRESNKKSLDEVIKISKNSSLVKSYGNNDKVRMSGSMTLKTLFWATNVTLVFAQKKLGFVAHKNNVMPLKPIQWLLVLISLIIKNTLGVYVFDSVLKKYPHMTSPITGLRETKELFYNYQETGSFVQSPTQIGQSEYLLKALYWLYQTMNGGDCALRCVFFTFDTISLLLQISIFTMVFQATAKKEAYTTLALVWILFGPISLFGGDSHYNLGAINDCLWYGIIYMTVLATRYSVSNLKLISLSIVALYFDPRLLFIMIAVNVLQIETSKSSPETKLSSVMEQVKQITMRCSIFYICAMVVMVPLMSKDQKSIIYNTLMVKDSSENVGMFWYLFLVMFKDKVQYTAYMYIVTQAIVVMFICQIIAQTSYMIKQLEQQPVSDEKKLNHLQKVQRRKERLVMTGFLFANIIKAIYNPYPTLHDFNIILFGMLMNITLIFKYVEGLYFWIQVLFYSFATSALAWNTWLDRFSGNANSFYGQTIALNGSMVLFMLQLMYSIDAKRKKYAKELVAFSDNQNKD